MIKIEHSKSLWPTLMGNNLKKCEMIKIILDHFGGKRLEKVQNEQNLAFKIIMDHFGGKKLEKVQNEQN